MSKDFCSEDNTLCIDDDIDARMEIGIIVSIGITEFIEDIARIIVQREILLSDNSHQYFSSTVNIALMCENEIKGNKGKAMSTREISDSLIKDDFVGK